MRTTSLRRRALAAAGALALVGTALVAGPATSPALAEPAPVSTSRLTEASTTPRGHQPTPRTRAGRRRPHRPSTSSASGSATICATRAWRPPCLPRHQ